MTEFYAALDSIRAVREFVSAASLTPVDIDVVSGRYTVDAKSILGLFSLNLDEPVQVKVYGTEADGQAFREKVVGMIVEPENP